ncbi:MAG: hypothetical protein NW201_12960 [Gemmatimonadales bacterium]|nr:hypothetical protein [Gemmatimonadales bacterium]
MLLSLDEVKAGMTVASEIRSTHGVTLIPKGAELSERHLVLLERSGIAHVDVEVPADAVAAAPPVSPEELAAAEARLEPRFAKADRAHPVLATVFRHCAVRDAEAAR